MSEAVFNFVNTWSLMFLPVMMADPRGKHIADKTKLGIWVVRVVIPDLMPMTSDYLGRFLGTPRLYDYPRQAGFGALSEQDINPQPQPFA